MKYVNTYSTVKDIDLAVANMREFLKNEYENSVGTFSLEQYFNPLRSQPKRQHYCRIVRHFKI